MYKDKTETEKPDAISVVLTDTQKNYSESSSPRGEPSEHISEAEEEESILKSPDRGGFGLDLQRLQTSLYEPLPDKKIAFDDLEEEFKKRIAALEEEVPKLRAD